MARVDELEMKARVDEILNRCPRSAWRREWSTTDAGNSSTAHGMAHIASRTPVTEDTVFQIASITKTSTAIAVMQLQEHGLIGLGHAGQQLSSRLPG
jgi:hypothetical protein